uniref:Zn(2)-C6 fungal-type domain-containing protein n=1 Tax=Ganoderma boninense TaxID=34458 RepID=A0A5K1K4I3_9APHY|nr:Zn(2)-C6 fungal-type domain-containing protein [Ganoderma boninense]
MQTPDCYEIKNPNPVFNIGQGQPLPSHVTFTDHSLSARARAPGSASAGVDLPDRTLLCVHAALAEVLHRSGAINTFWFLQQDFPSCPPRSRRGTVPAWSGSGSSYSYSASAGDAFWRSVVEYEGPEMCAEVELREAVQAMALGNSAGVVSHAVQ